LHIAGLHHRHCRDCPHPPGWPTARTHHRPTFVSDAEPRCYTSLAYIHMDCRVCRHPHGWPTAGTHRRPTFVRVGEPRCYTSLTYIHTCCRVCPYPPRWPTAPTALMAYFRSCCNSAVTYHWPTFILAAVSCRFLAAALTHLIVSHQSPYYSIPRSLSIP
jgi:hypothetical protein